MPDQKFSIKLEVNNIGPHFEDKKIVFTDEVDSNKSVFFATNGMGKSFLSRAFRLMAAEKQNELADELLTIGRSSGNMAFSIVNDDITKKLAITIERGKIPAIVNDTGLIFHVFNSDFVEENIKPRHYAPNGDIEGYILGKTQIDLTAEREREKQLKGEIENIGKVIDITIEKSKEGLRAQGVQPSTTEFGLIEKNKLRAEEKFEGIASFDEIVTQLNVLSKVPEKLEDVQTPSLNVDLSILENIISLLSTQYPKTEWDENFVSSMKANREFIEAGLAIAGDSNTCPFCKQLYGLDALNLIRDYKVYLADKEADVLRQIESSTRAICTITSSLKTTAQATKSAIAGISTLGRFFPSLAEITLDVPDINDSKLIEFSSILEQLEQKSADLTEVFPTINTSVNACKEVIAAAEAIVKRNAETIKNVNKTKDNSNSERLTLRRNLCKAQYTKYGAELRPYFAQYDEKKDSLGKLQKSIIEKEQQARISKRDKVYDTLTFFLNRFFAGKYSIDKNTFQIRFLGSNVGEKASSILSDGEKTLLLSAFFSLLHIYLWSVKGTTINFSL